MHYLHTQLLNQMIPDFFSGHLQLSETGDRSMVKMFGGSPEDSSGRLMQRMDRHLFKTQYFQGHLNSATLGMRAWALIYNFTPSNPQTEKKYGGEFRSPAERLNQKKYHEDWLKNLLIFSSISGYKPPPLNPL